MTIDVDKVKADFPILSQPGTNGNRLVFLDSGASSQRPVHVLEAMDSMYRTSYANVHRGVYGLAEKASSMYEGARDTVARFINAPSRDEVIVTKNVTEAINLVAYGWGLDNLKAGDVVVLTLMEHHANIVPWQILSQRLGIEIRWVGLTEEGELDLSNLDELLEGAKLLAFTGAANVLSTITPVKELAERAHRAGALALLDAAQMAPHLPLDVKATGCDFVAFTGHKMLGPTGIGILWGRRDLLQAMSPFLGGGDMIKQVTTKEFIANDLPWKFEAGTPPIVELVGLAAACDYLTELGMENVREHDLVLNRYALATLKERFGDDLVIHGPSDPEKRGGVLSIEYKDVHPHDLSQVLDSKGVCVRAGHHCAKPLMKHLGVGATARASWYIYNDERDIDALADALVAAEDLFAF